MPAKGAYAEKPPYIEIGQRFTRLTVVGQGPRVTNGRNGRSTVASWECLCDCGERRNIRKGELLKGSSKSCGCWTQDRRRARGTHRDTKSPEYRSWSMMLNRCFNRNSDDFAAYGGRGVTVCEEWQNSYVAFLESMGRRPSSAHSIERIKNDGNYTPDNCKWATPTEQANNRRSSRFVDFRGQRLTLAELARIANVNYGSLRSRLCRMDAEAAISGMEAQRGC